MVAYLILGFSLLFGLVFLARWFVGTEPRRIVPVARWAALIVALIAVGYLVWGGRQVLAAFFLPLMIPALLRYRALWSRIKAMSGPSPGQTSQVETRYLRMTLDHDSGVMTGVVREGPFRGRKLDELGIEDLVELWRECRVADAQSAAILETYLDRTQGEAWRQSAGQGPGSGPRAASTGMSREEALEILGLDAKASKRDIHEAHRRLMQQVHPDHGGSNYLAAKINQAKDLLLGG
jgi:hypothetical protein